LTLPTLPRRLSRASIALILVAWVVQVGRLVAHAYFREGAGVLSADLLRYGSSAQWKGVYYRGDKIGFLVTQTVPVDDGFELQEDGQLEMALLGISSKARVSTRARVDTTFNLKSFRFSLDAGTGPVEVGGDVQGKTLSLRVSSPSGTRSETRVLDEPPALAINLARRLTANKLEPGQKFTIALFDPTTMRNDTMDVTVVRREAVEAAGHRTPALKIQTRFVGLTSTSWITELGEVVREESPTGLLVKKETRDRALAPAPAGVARRDLLESASVIPSPARRIDDVLTIDTLRLRVSGFDMSGADTRGAGQSVDGDTVELRRLLDARGTLVDPGEGPLGDVAPYLVPESLIESDAPEIRDEARKAVPPTARSDRDKAEALVRFVHGALQKKPTVGIPSARDVLRTRVGDCNEHTALYVALARASNLPARIAVGLAYVHGAFYYHAWAEVAVRDSGAGFWIPVDPTLNQFPADATHLRLARGGLDRQTAILPAMGNIRIGILDMTLRPGTELAVVGQKPQEGGPIDIPLPRRESGAKSCWMQRGRR
jgi:hypothetical protein